MLRRLLPESIDISQDLHKEDPVVLVDTGQIEQVLINLATSARDAIAEIGRIGIATERFTMDSSFVESHGYGEPGEYAVLTVSDTGRGMDAGTRARIFEPFFTTKEGSETILIAEDDEILRKLARTLLGQYGYTVIEAEDGEDAVAKFAANKDAIRLASDACQSQYAHFVRSVGGTRHTGATRAGGGR
jgi:hypothetical protein